jgi:hypothetical protein
MSTREPQSLTNQTNISSVDSDPKVPTCQRESTLVGWIRPATHNTRFPHHPEQDISTLNRCCGGRGKRLGERL